MATGPPKPDTEETPNLTLLLNRMCKGDRASANEAADLVYRELHRIASREMWGERKGHTLQTTALVNEAYLRLAGPLNYVEIQNRGHFFALAARQMRRVLVDHARSSQAERLAGGLTPTDPDRISLGGSEENINILLLNECLEELAGMDPRAAKVIDLRYFGGYTDKEVAEALGTSLATVRRDWEFARSWLFDRMRRNDK
jgi:RNA polymerase sigma factor (TIGR02999 family)